MSNDHILDDLDSQVRIEFIDRARDRLDDMYRAIERVRADRRHGGEALTGLRSDAQNMKGTATAFGFPAVALISHRLADYLLGLEALTDKHIEDTVVFLDRLAEVVDRVEQPASEETNRIVRALPVRYSFDVADIEIKDVEIMLVTPSRVMAKKVGAEMAACGFRPVTVHDPIEAFGLAVRLPPDMLVASLVMDGLGGIDLIRALRAASVTESIPVAILTSLDPSHPQLRGLPAGVGVIRVGSSFSDDFASLVTRFNLG